MNKLRDHNPGPVEPFDDRLATLVGELELAARWERPSILFAVYCSDYVRAEAQAELEKQLAAGQQKICRVCGDASPDASFIDRIKTANGDCSPVIFVEGLASAREEDGRSLLEQLNAQRDAFVEEGLRVVFWLTEAQACDLANCAPDLWSFRHRVVEFPDVPEPEKILARTLDAAWQNFDIPTDSLGSGTMIPATLLNRLPQGEESAGVYINLLLTLGIMHWRKQDIDKADEFIRAATEIGEVTGDDRLLAECLNASALVRISQRKYEEAVQIYQRSLHAAPDQTFPWGHLGNLYSKLGRDHEAISAFKKALQTDPADAFSWQGMAEIYSRLQLGKPAIEHYQRAVELSPNLAGAWMGLAKIYGETGEIEQATAALGKCLDLDGRNEIAWLQLGGLLAQERKTAEALAAYGKVVELNPKNVAALRCAGEIYLGAKMNENAITTFRTAIALEPGSGADYRNLGLAHYQNGDFNEAALLYRKSLELTAIPALRAEICNRLGDSYRGLQEYDKAIQAYQAGDRITAGLPSGTAAQDPIERDETVSMAVAPQPTSVLDGVPEVFQVMGVEPTPAVDAVEQSALSLESELWVGGGMPFGDLSKSSNDLESEIFEPGTPARAMDADAGLDEASYWNNLGNQFLNQQAYSEAIAAYTHAVELSPTVNWPYIRNLTTAHYRKGKSRGEQPITPASDLSAEATFAEEAEEHAWRSESRGAGGAPSPSAADEDTMVIQPSTNGNQSIHRLIQHGNEQMRAGHFEEAAQTFIKAIEKQPEFGWAYCNLGLAYSHLDKDTYAVLALKKGIDYLDGDKEKAIAWRHLSEVYAKVGDPVNANFAMETAQSLEREKASLLQRARVMLLGNTTL